MLKLQTPFGAVQNTDNRARINIPAEETQSHTQRSIPKEQPAAHYFTQNEREQNEREREKEGEKEREGGGAGDVGLSRVKSPSCHWIAALRGSFPLKTASRYPESNQVSPDYKTAPLSSAQNFTPCTDTHAQTSQGTQTTSEGSCSRASSLLLWHTGDLNNLLK